MSKRNAWEERHMDALLCPQGPELPHVLLYRAVKAASARGWSHDGYAYQPLIELVRAARQLLNMESGRLDCGTLDGFYVQVLKTCGVDE